MARLDRTRIIRFFSTHKIFAILYIYQLTVQAFIRSIMPLWLASNYSLLFRFHVFSLELWFLLKASYALVFRKSFLSDKFFGYTMRFSNYLEFVLLFIEIWGIQEYRLQLKKERPKIVDCGSGWGMSVMYFKHFYPKARITAIEANKNTVVILRENIRRNNIRDVTMRRAFVCGRGGQHPFFMYQKFAGWSVSDTGAVDFTDTHSGFTKTRVPSTSLATLLRRGADIVKLDIEGMEGESLMSAKKELQNVSEVIIEYHPGMNRVQNRLEQISSVLKGAGFYFSVFNTESLFTAKNTLRIIHATRRT